MKNKEGEPEPLQRIKVADRLVQESRLEDFVTQNTSGLFDKLNISTAFLDLDPENWPSSEDYLKGLEVVQNIKVTNDHAERGVALVQEFNRHITHDEDQLQFLLYPNIGVSLTAKSQHWQHHDCFQTIVR